MDSNSNHQPSIAVGGGGDGAIDRISSLPDEILLKILSFLPTKNSAATPILSSRWTSIPVLDSSPNLDFDDSLLLHRNNVRYPDDDQKLTATFISFVEKALVSAHDNGFPAFQFLTTWKLVVPYPYCWETILHWLESAPNLKLLLLQKEITENSHLQGRCQLKAPDLQHLPTCLALHLKEIELWNFEKNEVVNILEYLVKNGKVLQKLTFDSHIILDDGVLLEDFFSD